MQSSDPTLGIYEVHQRFDSYISQIIRVDPNTDHIEFDWVVGPIPDIDHQGREVVTQYKTGLASGRTFYTDANGRQMLKRVWNHRPTWNVTLKEPISGNYYPVNSRIYLKDEAKDLQLTILNDRSQGGTSPVDGTLDIMVHRRLFHDDNFGVSDVLNEPGVDGKGLVIRGRHLLLVESIGKSAAKHRELGQQMFMEPLVTFTTNVSEADYRAKYQTQFTGLTVALPKNVHLLTLEQWSNDRLLLRLEHFYQKNEDAELSKPATVNLKNLFSGFEVVHAQELTLSGNSDIEATKNRLKFKYTPVGTVEEPEVHVFEANKMDVTLTPMQIRTFVVNVKRH